MIKVLIVDNQHIVRCGLKGFLDQYTDLELIGEATTTGQALDLVHSLQPDVVLIDINLHDEMTGTEAIRQIVTRYPDVKVIALNGLHHNRLLKAAIRAGAKGYLLKTVTSEELAEAIRRANSGKPLIPPEVVESLIADTQVQLTGREREVLGLIVQGLTNQQIAHQLNMSRYTVQFHVRNIRTKLGAKNRAELGAIAVQLRLVDSAATAE